MDDAKRRVLGFFRSKSAAESERLVVRKRGRERERERARINDRDLDGWGEIKRVRDGGESEGEGERSDIRHDKSKNKPCRSHRRDDEHHFHSPTRSRPDCSKSTTLLPLTAWPPPSHYVTESLSQDQAIQYIATGAPLFRGYKLPIAHAGKEYYHLFASYTGNGTEGGDGTEDPLISAASLRLQGLGKPIYPWETLEQPSMAFCVGARAGTVTLNHWVNLNSRVNPAIELRDFGVKPREVGLRLILERLIYLERGFEDDDEEVIYRNLYMNLLYDPDKLLTPHKTMKEQILDLVTVLSRKSWIDFSKKENQVVAKYFANATYADNGRYKLFFHQLLLAMELQLRIQSKKHGEGPKMKLLSILPQKVKWDLAVARRWRGGIRIENPGTTGDSDRVRFHLRRKKGQLDSLHTFARTLKWPSLPPLISIFNNSSAEIENRSSDTLTYFTSIILPGPTLPFLLMNSLIDIDPLCSSPALTALTHMYPNTGFQYKGSTFWSSNCIIGKVLAPTCKEIGGWIGPIRQAEGLERTQIARIRQRRLKRRMKDVDAESMAERSLSLGPAADRYPTNEYILVQPNLDPDSITDTIRVEKLALKMVTSSNLTSETDKNRPRMFDACVQFAVDGASWPLRLSFDVSFISACPCKGGPHPCFFDYEHQVEKLDGILRIQNWGVNGGNVSRRNSSAATHAEIHQDDSADHRHGDTYDDEKVLVIEAFGVADNEVLARAWCAHWGLSAIIADVEKTCVACAIREAYAACLNVAILVKGVWSSNDDD